MTRRVAIVFGLVGLLFTGAAAPSYAWYVQEGSSDYLPAASLYDEEPVQTGETAAAAAEPEAPPVVWYQVNQGDTLYKIAKDFGLALQDLLAANDIPNPNRLQIGQQLVIPSPIEGMPGLGSDGKPPVVRKVITSTLTAYTAGYESTGKTPSHPQYGITYSGSKAVEGRTIAVDPAVIPLGSTVYIEGIGLRKAEDTGSAIRGSKIDMFMNDLQQATDFGVKKNVRVYVLSSDAA